MSVGVVWRLLAASSNELYVKFFLVTCFLEIAVYCTESNISSWLSYHLTRFNSARAQSGKEKT